jgi:hypothetical protein
MLAYYLFAAIVANAALLLNIFILLGVMCAVDHPDAAGYRGHRPDGGHGGRRERPDFERIREELASGKSMRGALTRGTRRRSGPSSIRTSRP